MLGFKSVEVLKAEINELLKDKLQPGENVIATALQVREVPSNWWLLLTGIIIVVGQKFYRLALTNKRLFIIEVGLTNNLQSYVVYNLSELKVKKVSGFGIFGKTLHLILPDGSIKKLKFNSIGSDKGIVDQVANAIPKLQQ